MPELPEVETVRRGLESLVMGAVIARVDVRDARLRRPIDPAALKKDVLGRTIVAVERRAKYLIVRLSGERSILMHLGMSGRMRVLNAADPVEPHTHVVFGLEDGREIRFRDPRRFGMVEAVLDRALETHPLLTHLGPEPLAHTFTGETIHARSRRSKKPLKNFIMDQSVVVGVGNIYAAEALYIARLSPFRAAGRLARAEADRLVDAIKTTLREAVRLGGTTLNDFANVDGDGGYFQISLLVYDRAGEPCNACGAPIRRRVLGGRSSFYCRNCQR